LRLQGANPQRQQTRCCGVQLEHQARESKPVSSRCRVEPQTDHVRNRPPQARERRPTAECAAQRRFWALSPIGCPGRPERGGVFSDAPWCGAQSPPPGCRWQVLKPWPSPLSIRPARMPRILPWPAIEPLGGWRPPLHGRSSRACVVRWDRQAQRVSRPCASAASDALVLTAPWPDVYRSSRFQGSRCLDGAARAGGLFRPALDQKQPPASGAALPTRHHLGDSWPIASDTACWQRCLTGLPSSLPAGMPKPEVI